MNIPSSPPVVKVISDSFDYQEQLNLARDSISKIYSDYALTYFNIFDFDSKHYRFLPLCQTVFDFPENPESEIERIKPYTIRTYERFKSRYITDLLSQSVVRSWQSQSAVVINAQTASGKTTLAVDTLPSLLSDEQYLLIIVPRSALKIQYVRDVAEKYDPSVLESYSFTGLSIVNKIRNVLIFTFQELAENSEKRKYLISIRQKIRFTVLDEFHAFISDSLFNCYTYKALKTLIEDIGVYSVRIYLSATPEKALTEVIYLEAQNKGRPFECSSLLFRFMPSMQIYTFARDYQYLSVCFFYKETEILDKICTCRSKSLVFVESIFEGQRLQRLMTEQGKKAELITAESKVKNKSPEYRELIEKGLFSYDVLIATKWLDVGVNIKDSDVSNIVSYHLDASDIIQMCGRLRTTKETKITLFQYVPDIGEIRKRLHEIQETKKAFLENRKIISRKSSFTTLENGFYAERQRGGTYAIIENYFYFVELENELSFYSSMLDCPETTFSDNFRKRVTGWFPGCSVTSLEGNDLTCMSPDALNARTQILEDIAQHMDFYTAAEMTTICNHIVLDICHVKRRSTEIDAMPKKTIREIFETYSIPYRLINHSKDQYCFEKQEV